MRRFAAAVKLDFDALQKPSQERIAETLASPLQSVVDEWLSVVIGRPRPDGITQATGKTYRLAFGLLFRAGINRVNHLQSHIVRAFLAARIGNGITHQTNNHTLTAIGSLTRWLHSQGRFPIEMRSELFTLYTQELARPAPHFLTPVQFLELRRATENAHPLLADGISLAIETGARPNEWRTLRFEELWLNDNPPYAFIRPGKTYRSRTVPLRGSTTQAWLARGWADRIGPLLPARSRERELLLDGHVHPSTLRDWLGEVRRDFDFHVDWLTLRHTFASWHVQAGTSITKVAGWLGHNVYTCWKHYAALVPGGDVAIEQGFAALAKLEAGG